MKKPLSKAEEERALELHDRATIVALHTDYIGDISERRSRGEKRIMETRHVPKLLEGGITAICDHVIGETFECLCFPLNRLINTPYSSVNFPMRKHYGWTRFHATNPSEHALQLMDYVLSDLEESSGISPVSTVEEIVEAKREGEIAMILCAQGCAAIEDDLSILRNFYRLGIRCVSLVVNHRNLLADSMWSRTNHGLSEFGEEVVEEANRLGMVIDVYHISKQGFMDVLGLSSDPLIASNVNIHAVCDNFKNLTDEMMKALAENCGVIGLHAKSDLVTDKPKSTVEDLVNHVDYITETVGVDHVGIGPDIVSTDMYPKELCDRIWGEGQPFLGKYPEGFDHISKMANITRGLVKRGYSDQEMEKVLGLNALRVFKKVWGN
jgi:membrane dipeptidase